jgi:hypothetical protein
MAGEWNVDKIARGLTAKQFIEWRLYARMEPFGEERDDFRAASIRQMVFNMAVKNSDRKPLGDFVLKFGESEQPKPVQQPWQEKKAIAMTIAMAYASRGTQKSAQSSDEIARAMATDAMGALKKEP